MQEPEILMYIRSVLVAGSVVLVLIHVSWARVVIAVVTGWWSHPGASK